MVGHPSRPRGPGAVEPPRMPRLRAASARLAALAFAVLAALSADAARAEDPADPGEPPELEHTADMIPETVATGFYLRLDAGAAIGGTPAFEPDRRYGDAELPTTGTFGAGAGLKATEWLRGDLTLDYTPASRVAADCRPCAGGRRAGTDLSTLVVLANAYVDLPELGPVTPYLGAGIGGAVAFTDDTRTGRRPGRPRSGSDAVLAWAVGGGAALALGPATSLDLGYRYVGLGDVDTGGGRPRRATLAGLGLHEIRLGVRVGTW